MMTSRDRNEGAGDRPEARCAGSSGSASGFRLAASVTLLDAVLAAGPALSDLLRSDVVSPSGTLPGHASLMLAMHAAGPRLALAASAVIAVWTRSTVALTALGAALALSQAMDAVTFAVLADTASAAVPVLAAAFQVWALALLDMQAGARPATGRTAGDRG